MLFCANSDLENTYSYRYSSGQTEGPASVIFMGRVSIQNIVFCDFVALIEIINVFYCT